MMKSSSGVFSTVDVLVLSRHDCSVDACSTVLRRDCSCQGRRSRIGVAKPWRCVGSSAHWSDAGGERLFRRPIDCKVIVKEILSGTSDVQLMAKYGLSAFDLEDVFRTLLDIRAINHVDVLSWSIFGNKVISTDTLRMFPRNNLELVIPIVEVRAPHVEGVVKNVSRSGLCVEGLNAVVGKVQTFSLALDMSRQVVSHPFAAQCRWIAHAHVSDVALSGYSIEESSRKAWAKILHGIDIVRHLMHLRTNGRGPGNRLP